MQMGDVFQILRLLWIVILRYQVTLWDENGIIENDPVNRLIAWLKDHVQEINERYFTLQFYSHSTYKKDRIQKIV